MNKYAIITDTDSSLTAELAKQYQIQQVPITIEFGKESYSSGVDIDDATLFDKVTRLGKLPTTAAPSPGAFVKAYEKAFNGGADAILCICVSSKVSTTYNAALIARESYPGKDITVIDSLNLSMGQGFMAIEAAKAAQQGLSKEAILARVEAAGKSVHLYAVLSTLKYLALGGRVSKFTAGMADTLNVKPILTVKDGELAQADRVRTHQKAVARIVELVRASLDGKNISAAAILHANNLSGAQEFQRKIFSELPAPAVIHTVQFSPGLAVHSGPGVVGIVALTE